MNSVFRDVFDGNLCRERETERGRSSSHFQIKLHSSATSKFIYRNITRSGAPGCHPNCPEPASSNYFSNLVDSVEIVHGCKITSEFYIILCALAS